MAGEFLLKRGALSISRFARVHLASREISRHPITESGHLLASGRFYEIRPPGGINPTAWDEITS